MSHDPLCVPPWSYGKGGYCEGCDLIAKARADERGRVVSEAIAAILADYKGTPTLGVHKAVRRVEALADSPPAGPVEGTGSAGGATVTANVYDLDGVQVLVRVFQPSGHVQVSTRAGLGDTWSRPLEASSSEVTAT